MNKEKIKLLLGQGLMTKAGLISIEIAKKNGSWNILDSTEALIIPDDLKLNSSSNPVQRIFSAV